MHCDAGLGHGDAYNVAVLIDRNVLAVAMRASSLGPCSVKLHPAAVELNDPEFLVLSCRERRRGPIENEESRGVP